MTKLPSFLQLIAVFSCFLQTSYAAHLPQQYDNTSEVLLSSPEVEQEDENAAQVFWDLFAGDAEDVEPEEHDRNKFDIEIDEDSNNNHIPSNSASRSRHAKRHIDVVVRRIKNHYWKPPRHFYYGRRGNKRADKWKYIGSSGAGTRNYKKVRKASELKDWDKPKQKRKGTLNHDYKEQGNQV